MISAVLTGFYNYVGIDIMNFDEYPDIGVLL